LIPINSSYLGGVDKSPCFSIRESDAIALKKIRLGIVKSWIKAIVREIIITPNADDHKYSRGVLGIVTGSINFPGAAVLSVSAANQTGIGMIRFYSPNKETGQLVLAKNPEVVTEPGLVDAFLLGSGIVEKNIFSTKRHRELKQAAKLNLPTVLDAGAVFLAGKIEAPTIITPHYGELARLLNSRNHSCTVKDIYENPEKLARFAARKLGVNVLLKGNKTFVSDGVEVEELPQATTFLATAGSGDVLAGILGALVCSNRKRLSSQRVSLLEIGVGASFIHAQAALLASKHNSITASMIINKIPKAIAKILD